MGMLASGRFSGERLRELRKGKAWSQSDLAGRINAHVTSVSDWERGANAPSGRHIASLAAEFGVDASHFYGDEDDEEDSLAPLAQDLAAELTAAIQNAAAAAVKAAMDSAKKGRAA